MNIITLHLVSIEHMLAEYISISCLYGHIIIVPVLLCMSLGGIQVRVKNPVYYNIFKNSSQTRI